MASNDNTSESSELNLTENELRELLGKDYAGDLVNVYL